MKDAYEDFIDKLYRRKAIDLSGYKRPQMERRINSLMKMMNVDNYDVYLKILDNDPSHFRKFVDTLTINVSEFYRNPNQWDNLIKVIIPDLVKNSGNSLKIWSAGCSTGEEPYTLAMVMTNEFPHITTQIIASDIDAEVLAKAKQGLYIEKALVNLPKNYVSKYFNMENNNYIVGPEIKKKVKFVSQNLLRDNFDKNFDLILCRNVVIYFTEETKIMLYNKFHQALKMQGILFTGSTEQIFQARDIGFELEQSFFYRRVK